MNLKEARDIIKDKLPETERLAQFAEKCAELAKAALKLRRVIAGDIPTTVRYVIWKECGDALCCAQILLSHEEFQEVFDIAVSKTMRWAECLQERDKENETE